MAIEALFKQKAPGIMQMLMADFDLTVYDAAAIVGNLGHESGGFKFLQELKPMVPGSKGGWGWAQWTGPRRRSFEAYCKRNRLDPASDKANYGWLWNELHGSEKAAIPAVKKAATLRDKVVAFENKFERSGIKHYESRLVWAEKALEAFKAHPAAAIPVSPPAPIPEPVTAPATKPVATGLGIGGALVALIWAVVEYFT